MDQMNMKRVIRLGLAAAFILATGLCIFPWPHMVQAEYGGTDVWGYSQWWNSDYASLWADYAPWQPPPTSYASQWPSYDPASNQSFVTYRQGDNLSGLLSQGLPVYIPPQVSFFESSYRYMGNPGAYLPVTQWPQYSYATKPYYSGNHIIMFDLWDAVKSWESPSPEEVSKWYAMACPECISWRLTASPIPTPFSSQAK